MFICGVCFLWLPKRPTPSRPQGLKRVRICHTSLPLSSSLASSSNGFFFLSRCWLLQKKSKARDFFDQERRKTSFCCTHILFQFPKSCWFSESLFIIGSFSSPLTSDPSDWETEMKREKSLMLRGLIRFNLVGVVVWPASPSDKPFKRRSIWRFCKNSKHSLSRKKVVKFCFCWTEDFIGFRCGFVVGWLLTSSLEDSRARRGYQLRSWDHRTWSCGSWIRSWIAWSIPCTCWARKHQPWSQRAMRSIQHPWRVLQFRKQSSPCTLRFG